MSNLVPCTHCGGKVAKNCTRCPHCGGTWRRVIKLNDEPESGSGVQLLFAIIGMVGLFVVLWVGCSRAMRGPGEGW